MKDVSEYEWQHFENIRLQKLYSAKLSSWFYRLQKYDCCENRSMNTCLILVYLNHGLHPILLQPYKGFTNQNRLQNKYYFLVYNKYYLGYFWHTFNLTMRLKTPSILWSSSTSLTSISISLVFFFLKFGYKVISTRTCLYEAICVNSCSRQRIICFKTSINTKNKTN